MATKTKKKERKRTEKVECIHNGIKLLWWLEECEFDEDHIDLLAQDPSGTIWKILQIDPEGGIRLYQGIDPEATGLQVEDHEPGTLVPVDVGEKE